MLALALVLTANVELNGFLSNRVQVTLPSESSLLSTKDNPILADLSEANLHVTARLLDEKLRIGADVSAFFLLAGAHADADVDTGALRTIEAEDTASAARAFVSLSEAYVSLEPVVHVVLTAGKKRTVWGPGLVFSPTDLLNPARDPTDPSLQRAGFVHGRIDLPFELFTVSALFAPAVLEEQDAIPTSVLVDDDDVLHYAAAVRAYALVGDADINAWLLWTNRYQDAFENKPRLALTLSKSLFSIHEFHAEVLGQTGSARRRVNPSCVETQQALALCALTRADIVNDDLLTSDFVLPDILVGWRTMPDDGSMIVVEYLYQADGYLRSEYDDVISLLAIVGRFQREGREVPLPSVSAGGGAGVPTRVSFDPLRRHYLALSYTRPQVLDDFTLAGTLITPLEDLSMLLSGSIAWQAQDWLALSLFSFVTVASPARASADMSGDPWQQLYDSIENPSLRDFVPRGALVDGVPVGEFDGAPFRAQLMLEAKAFF